jgi:hypothetical protein
MRQCGIMWITTKENNINPLEYNYSLIEILLKLLI